jgi:7-cyano-7-deazaguanine synthase
MTYMEFYEEDIDYILKHTHSCYCPDEHGRSCGQCGTCKERIEAFEANCMVDPIEYAE